MLKHNIVYTDFCDWAFTVTKAQGSFLWDEHGKRYIDFTSGWNVTNLGWNRPEIVDAVRKQAGRNLYAPMWMNDEIQAEYAAALVKHLPAGLDAVIRATGGTDANEKALMLARSLTGRKKIIGFRDTYHGHSYGTISIGYRDEYVTGEAPVVPEFIKMDFPVATGETGQDRKILDDFAALLDQKLAKRDVAAIVTEAGIVTGWGTTPVAPAGYLPLIRSLTEKYGTFLILDEVGTGFSRTGKLFGMDQDGVIPDIVTFAKGMTNGAAAAGACVTKSSFGERELSKAKTHSTFGWTSVACSASLTVLNIHTREKVWELAAAKGSTLMSSLRSKLSDNRHVGTIQGMGMEIGVTFVSDRKSEKPDDGCAKRVIARCHDAGLHVIFGGDGNIQIMPPLTIPTEILQEGTDLFIEAVRKEAS